MNQLETAWNADTIYISWFRGGRHLQMEPCHLVKLWFH